VIPRKQLPSRLAALAVLSLAFAALAALPGQSEESSLRAQQIADAEKQYQEARQKADELKKKLDDLRAQGEKPPPAPDGSLPADWVKTLSWRCIGPAAMGGRITSLTVFEADPSTYWVATASGGLLKTTNNGVTFEHQFDHEASVSIGSVCVAPSDRNIVWVGTGENNPRNSVSCGDGVYKSVDGGKHWQNMGLKETFQIGRVVIHPTNPNIVYVGALGRLYGPSKERGLYKTSDGGKTWQQVLFVDDRTGVIDLVMKPDDPETLIVATWERQRDGFDSHPGDEVAIEDGYDGYDPGKKWGPGSRLYRTKDGGKTWDRLTKGLPTCNLGRTGLDYYRKTPNTVYAIIDSEKIGRGDPPVWLGIGVQDAVDSGVKVTSVEARSPAAKVELKAGDVLTALDKKPLKDRASLSEELLGHRVGDKVTLTVKRDKETKELALTLETAPRPYLGFQGETVEGGQRVVAVVADAPAARAGVKPEDVLQAIDKKEIKESQQVSEALRDKRAGDKVTLTVRRAKDKLDLVLTLADRPVGRLHSFMYSGQRENVQRQQGPDGWQYGGLYKSTDGGDTWTRLNSVNPRPMYFSQVRVDPSDDKFLYVLGVSLYRSSDGGKTFTPSGNRGVHPDQHALWIDPRDGRHMIVGCDGGFYATYDRMEHWDFLNHMAIGQFYHVALDNRRPYHVYGGLQDNGSWGGPSRALHGAGPINEDWIEVGGGDGFVCGVDPTDPDQIYFESQDGNVRRRNLRTGEGGSIRPAARPEAPAHRFNWNTPFLLSHHNPSIIYTGGNYVFRSYKKGADLRPISPEITRTKRGSATALAESPRNPDILWAGTDDGGLWVTRDGGREWKNVADKVGLPGPRWVASIEASRGTDGRAYVVCDGHRSDDDAPYVFATEDFGETWKSLRANLPAGWTRVLREDVGNTNLLYLGTEFAVYASTNRGTSWTKINNNLPTVAVHEIAVHPTAGEIVAATHGRSLWVLDVTTLRQMTADALKAKAKLYRPNIVVYWKSEPSRGAGSWGGSRHFAGQNPPGGAQVYYSLTKKATKVGVKVVDYAGSTVTTLRDPKTEPGLHLLTWDLGRGGALGGRAPAGTYRVVLSADGEDQSQPLVIENDPNVLPGTIIAEEKEEAEDDAEEMEREEKGMKAGREEREGRKVDY